MKRNLLVVLMMTVFTLGSLFAVDYGAFLQLGFEAGGAEEADASGSIIIAPWVSVPIGESELYVSLGFNTRIAKESYIAPEVYRLEFSTRLTEQFTLRVGRFNWQDLSGFVAKGRFDVAEV